MQSKPAAAWLYEDKYIICPIVDGALVYNG